MLCAGAGSELPPLRADIVPCKLGMRGQPAFSDGRFRLSNAVGHRVVGVILTSRPPTLKRSFLSSAAHILARSNIARKVSLVTGYTISKLRSRMSKERRTILPGSAFRAFVIGFISEVSTTSYKKPGVCKLTFDGTLTLALGKDPVRHRNRNLRRFDRGNRLN